MKNYWQGIYFLQTKNWWWKGKEKVIQLFLNRYCKLTDSSKVLDIGCGPGFGMKVLNSYSIGFGVDIFDEALRFCNRQGLNRLAKASAEHLPFKENVFDGISLIDSLEHMEDDQHVILECYRAIKRDGFLLLTVPAHKALWTTRDVFLGHKRRYSYAALHKLLTAYGFSIKKISHTNSFLAPIIFFFAVFEKITNLKIKVDNEGVQNFNFTINKFMYCILEIEAILITKMSLPFGSSIICLAQKHHI